ncbi:MAG: TonB-dependent receptor plug domain-containing protein [Gemmatimonadaceae bacterium]|nr:TonB-dependent receptor plug domain-containing protein [Gemmatimonadaceae bacterium]
MLARAIGVLMVGVAVRSLGAQVVPDSTKRTARDSLAVRAAQDSVRAERNRLAQARVDSIARIKAADTIKAPLAHFEVPDNVELSNRLRFSRQQILMSGATNLADLLDNVPGVTSYRTRWMAGIHAVAFNGDFRRIRVFFDGVERDAIEARNGRVLDLSDIPIWNLDEMIVERVAGEVRVWLRGWTVQRTTASTRVDIFTGDLNTNGFRGLFARRFSNGFSLQFIGQQMATQSGRVSAFTTTGTAQGAGDGDGKLLDLRAGWARGRFTIDAQGSATSRNRDPQSAREGFTNLPAYKGTRREGFARFAYGDSARGLWTHAIVGALRTRLEGIAATGTTVDSSASRDTTEARTQQILAVGYRSRLWHVSAVDRVRPVSGTSYHAPALRAGAGTERYAVAVYGEQRPLDSLTQVDLTVRAQPVPWLTVVASQSRRTPDHDTARTALTSTRLEGAVRLRGLWLGGGILRDGATRYDSPVLLGAPTSNVPSVAANGFVASGRGALYKALSIDVQAVHWQQAQYSRPRTSVRTELALVSNWLGHFPKGQFTINTRVIHELRGSVPFYFASGSGLTPRVATNSQVVTGLLEIRIQSATIFYRYQNITGRAYEQIPGITMPPMVQMYGVRWEFWN